MSSFGKTWFVLSLALLSFGYGFAAHAWDWFPKTHLQRAWRQAQAFYGGTGGMVEQVYDRSGARTVDSSAVQPGMTLVTSYWARGKDDRPTPGARLIDQQGRVMHEWHPDIDTLFQRSDIRGGRDPRKADFDGSYLFPNGDLLLILEYIGAVRLDACGRANWRLRKGAHHYLSRAEDGSFWIPGISAERRTTTAKYPDGFPGIEKPVWLDQILHVSAEGEVLSTTNVLDLLYENGLERHLVKALKPYPDEVPNDPVHLNDVEPLESSMAAAYPLFEAGDLLVSLRHPSLVFVFDPKTGRVKWHASHPFLHQHDPDFTGDGWIGVFDNNADLTERGTMLGGSRIVFLQPHTDSVEVRFPTPRSDPLYTSVQGQWQLLASGNMLLTETNAGRVVEVGPDGRTVWEWIREPHDASETAIVTGASRYALTREQVASWPCSSADSGRRSAREK